MVEKVIKSLYIHIPFCSSICYYCDFLKFLNLSQFTKKYIKVVIEELKTLNIKNKLKTIYIGGGTPTCINLEKLLQELQPYICDKTEFTIEGNILDFNVKLLNQYKKYRVNRISLGVQSTNNKILKFLGRKHTKEDVFKKIALIKKYISNINVDLIYGFNKLNNDMLINELNDYIKLDVPHISTYSLEINKGTIFFNQKIKKMDANLVRTQFDIIYQFLTNYGYKRYEISNFAREKFMSKHNLNYWNDDQYYAIGLGASSYIKNFRMKNTMNLHKYLNKNFIKKKEKIKISDDKKIFLMLNLRKISGFNLNEYKKRFNIDLLREKKEIINKLIKRQLLIKKNNNLLTTYDGSMLLDMILRELF